MVIVKGSVDKYILYFRNCCR